MSVIENKECHTNSETQNVSQLEIGLFWNTSGKDHCHSLVRKTEYVLKICLLKL